VLLIPGFLAGDDSLRPFADLLRAAGHQPHMSGIRCNVGCSDAAARGLVAAVERLAERAGQPVALVGHSRGGLFARVVARRRPDLVASVVTMASPYRDQLAIHPLLWALAAALATAGTLHVPGVLRWSCRGSGCCEDFARDLAAPLPRQVPALSLYSRTDGVVDWRACVDSDTPSLEVAATHCGMTLHGPTAWAVAAAISDLTPPARAPRRQRWDAARGSATAASLAA
jgi:pimeloyl-ACP methyl ester carboxylesterase